MSEKWNSINCGIKVVIFVIGAINGADRGVNWDEIYFACAISYAAWILSKVLENQLLIISGSPKVLGMLVILLGFGW